MMRSSISLGLLRRPLAISVRSSGRILSLDLPLDSSTSKEGFSVLRNKSPLLLEGWPPVILRSPSELPLVLANPLFLRLQNSPGRNCDLNIFCILTTFVFPRLHGDSSRHLKNVPSIILDGQILTESKRSSQSSRRCTVSPIAAEPLIQRTSS